MKKKLIPYTEKTQIKHFIDTLYHNVNAEFIDKLTQHQYSRNSVLAFYNDWRRYLHFCQQCHITPLPASITAVRRFLETESQQRRFSSVRRSCVNLGTLHKLLSLPNPVNHRQIKYALIRLRESKGQDSVQAQPMTRAQLDQLNRLLGKEKSTKARRDLAIYNLMFECALKRSELKNLSFENLSTPEQNMVVELGANRYQLSEQATRSMQNWLQVLEVEQGPLFRAIDKHGNISEAQLDDSSIYRVMRAASDLLGVKRAFSGQSSRVGAVFELRKQGLKVKEIQEFGRWSSPVMPAQYIGWHENAEEGKIRYLSFTPWD